MQTKALPNSHESESATLGSMLLDPRAVAAVARILTADDYYQPKHGTIHDAIVDLNARGDAVDMVKLVAYLEDKGRLKQVGGVEYLIELFESVPSSTSAAAYAQVVADRALRRRTIDVLHTAGEAAYMGSDGASEGLDSTIGSLMALRPSVTALSGPLSGFVEESTLPDPDSLGTGIRPLDAILGGWEPGSFNIVGARPSQGKTALSIAIASHYGREDIRCGFISAEMAGKKIGRRFVCQEAGLNMGRVRAGNISPAERESGMVAQRSVQSWPLWLDETPGITLAQLQAQARQWKIDHDIKVLFVDYLQLMSHKYESDFEGVTANTRGLKHLGRELGIVVVCLAQINREGAQGGPPRTSQLKGSGEIEQSADSITMIHKTDRCTQLIVGKNRDGETGVAEVHFDGGTGRFTETHTF